jgi:hypothetical protein
MRNVSTLLVFIGLLYSGLAEAKSIRATELNGSLWARITAGSSEELVVEFRQGDELPISFSTEGDLLETSRVGASYVNVKRNFWLKIEGSDVQMSLDGSVYRPIKDMISGSIVAGAGSGDNGGVANSISIGLKANLK